MRQNKGLSITLVLEILGRKVVLLRLKVMNGRRDQEAIQISELLLLSEF